MNFVRLYSAGASDEFDMQIFNAGDYVKAVEQKMVSETISKVLYPSDSVQAGRELRLLQEYFFVACAIGDIIRGFLRRGEDDFRELPSKVAIQLNDTHPTLAIVELMRVLVDDQDLQWNMAWEITQSTFSYTNHTLMPEALERWPVSLMERVLPRHLQIVYEINRRFLGEAAVGRQRRGPAPFDRRGGLRKPGPDGASGDRRQPCGQRRFGVAFGVAQDATGLPNSTSFGPSGSATRPMGSPSGDGF